MFDGLIHAAAQLVAPAARSPVARDTPGSAGAETFATIIRREQPSPATGATGPLEPRAVPRPQPTGTGDDLLTRHLIRVVDDHRALERTMRRALRGSRFSPRQLLALQMQVSRYSIEVETVSRVTDRLAGAVKQTMQTQI